jgi:hypothetical protein
MVREILSKSNFFDFELPDSAISRFPMILMKSMTSLHQGPKVSKLNCGEKGLDFRPLLQMKILVAML